MTKKPARIKHRMKRPQPPGARPGRIEHDIKRALTVDQLAEIGAISLKFNQVESLVEFILLVVLDVPPVLSWEVIRRINGMDAKLSILRQYYEENKILTDEAKRCLKQALDAVADYKKYLVCPMTWTKALVSTSQLKRSQSKSC